MIFRIAAALAFTAIGGIIGFSLSDKLRSAKKNCRAVDHLLQRASFLIGSRSEDVYTICRELKADSELKNLRFLQLLPDRYIAGENFHICWENALDSEENIGDEEKEILLGFGAVLGKSDSAAQISAINGLRQELEALTAVRREDLVKKGRLYRTAGLLFGVMAGILVL